MSKIEEVVREKYGAVAASDHAGVRAVAGAFGYTLRRTSGAWPGRCSR